MSSNLRPLLIASYRHNDHGNENRLYGVMPVMCGPRTYTNGRQIWRVVAKIVLPEKDELGRHIADEIDMLLSYEGHQRIGHQQAIAVAELEVADHLKSVDSYIDYHVSLYVMLPATELAAKRKAVAKRKNKR